MELLPKFDEHGLIPVIVQFIDSHKVGMLGYMNEEAFKLTVSQRRLYLFSRSRQKLWLKGEVSKNYLKIKEIFLDCDGDALLVLVQQTNYKTKICHLNADSCFHIKI